MSALETLLSEHRSTLSNLYTKLSPAPLPLLTSKLDLLHQALASTISQQRLEAEQEIEAVETSLDDKRKKAKHWRNALGEQDNKDQEEQSANGIPLLTQLTSVEKILNGMRERMETRGRMILKLQATLLSFTHILGMTWLSIEIPAEPLTEWDGQDLRLERLSALEREIVRCESEIVRFIVQHSSFESRTDGHLSPYARNSLIVQSQRNYQCQRHRNLCHSS